MTLWPNGTTTKPYITSPFGPRNLANPNASKYHRGADMVRFREVKAIESGQVKVTGTPSGWAGGGIQVWIQHDGYFSRSLHLASYSVKKDQFVRAGETIGIMGTTPHVDLHLHLEISPGNVHYSNTGQVDPVAFISQRLGGSPAGGGSTPPEEDMPTSEEIAQAVWTHRIANKQGGAGAVYGRAADWLTNLSDAVANLPLDIATAVSVIRADLNYIHVLSPYSLKAILEASKAGTVQLTDAQAEAIGGKLSAVAVSSLVAALEENEAAVLAELKKQPTEFLLALKEAL